MTRQRQVFPRDKVAHLWAHAAQDSARDAARNFYFNGPTLYSYGSHFAIARRMVNADGTIWYLFNADTYSSTTARHIRTAGAAIPSYNSIRYIAGLRENSFNGQWRGRMMRDALSQAGAAYDSAARLTRKSAKRDTFIATAQSRIATAQALADNVRQDKAASAADKRAARDTLRTIAALPTWDDDADNKAQQANATALAFALVRDEQRAIMQDKITRGLRDIETARDASPRIGRGNERARYRQQQARDALNLFDTARDIAKRYRFKLPKLPDAAAIIAELEPAARLETLQECASDARAALERAEQSWRLRVNNSRGWHHSSASHYLQQVKDAERVADSYDAPETVPQWMRDRAAETARKYARYCAVESAATGAGRIAGMLQSGDSYAQAGHARDAVREYRSVQKASQNIGDALPASHPARRHMPNAATLRRIAEYVTTSDARIAAENAERIAAWRDGGPLTFGRTELPLLRLSRDGRRIETSHGADVPVLVAPMIWQAANACRDTATAHDFNPAPRIGHFTLDRIETNGDVIAGCHHIPFTELEFIAARLGYIAETTAA